MTPETILADLLESGIELGVTPDNTGILVPAGKLSPGQRAAVLAHKLDLISYLLESMSIKAQLLDAALQRCEEFKDIEKHRQDMREQILETPPHLRQDLLEHFLGTQSLALVPPLKKQRENNHDQ
jgi:hypothetical protein